MVVLHDLFDTYESTQILIRQVVRRSHCQVLLLNFPGQALTQCAEEPSAGAPVFNNDYNADCLAQLMEVHDSCAFRVCVAVGCLVRYPPLADDADNSLKDLFTATVLFRRAFLMASTSMHLA